MGFCKQWLATGQFAAHAGFESRGVECAGQPEIIGFASDDDCDDHCDGGRQKHGQKEAPEETGVPGGKVPDFITLDYWPTFNLADACVTVGVIVIVVALLFGSRAQFQTKVGEAT